MSTGQSPAVSAVPYKIDPVHSTVDFRVRHLMIANLRGDFSGVAGTVLLDRQNPVNSKIEAAVQAATINTRDANRDQHLKATEFLDVEKYPKITFVSNRIAPAGNERWKATGDLTLHGVTHEVTLEIDGPTQEAKDPWGNFRIAASATAKIDRRDFGLTWNVALEAGGVLVSNEVTINLEVELVRQQPS